MRLKLRPVERRHARAKILEIANNNRASWASKPYTMRNINEAVHAVRSRHLAPHNLLVSAGFNQENKKR